MVEDKLLAVVLYTKMEEGDGGKANIVEGVVASN